MIEAKHQGHGESAHAVLTGKFLGTVMREAFDLSRAVLAKWRIE